MLINIEINGEEISEELYKKLIPNMKKTIMEQVKKEIDPLIEQTLKKPSNRYENMRYIEEGISEGVKEEFNRFAHECFRQSNNDLTATIIRDFVEKIVKGDKDIVDKLIDSIAYCVARDFRITPARRDALAKAIIKLTESEE